jgi:putative tryptophan/tyrosine transport system substrate-binding protein
VRRREFISLFGAAAAAWPGTARAQQPAGKLPTIGFLGTDAAFWRQWADAFTARLRELGWIEGRTVAIEYRWSEGRPERAAEIAAEFVRLKVDVIVTNGVSASVIPIVFALGLDPVGSGLVTNLAQPGGNVTGLSTQSAELADKNVELLREVVPRLRRLAIIGDAGFDQAVLEMGNAESAARTLGLEVVLLKIRRAEDIAPAFETLDAQADALYVAVDALVAANRTRIITLALGARLPTIFNQREFVQAGGLMSYGPNFSVLFRRSADLISSLISRPPRRSASESRNLSWRAPIR